MPTRTAPTLSAAVIARARAQADELAAAVDDGRVPIADGDLWVRALHAAPDLALRQLQSLPVGVHRQANVLELHRPLVDAHATDLARRLGVDAGDLL